MIVGEGAPAERIVAAWRVDLAQLLGWLVAFAVPVVGLVAHVCEYELRHGVDSDVVTSLVCEASFTGELVEGVGVLVSHWFHRLSLHASRYSDARRIVLGFPCPRGSDQPRGLLFNVLNYSTTQVYNQIYTTDITKVTKNRCYGITHVIHI